MTTIAQVLRRSVPRLSLSAQILIGLGLGIFLGLFIGEPAAELQPVADIYIRLMQMMVLPYLITALILAFGSLSASAALRLARIGGFTLLLVLALTAGLIAIMPASFPPFESAAFFSDALIEPIQPFSLADVYFTSNPFESLSRAVIPAVVLFSVFIGIALMGLDGKQGLLDQLALWNSAFVRVTGFIVKLTPIGVFAIGAVTAGTMTPETFIRLEVYFIAFGALALLLAFWVLPLMATAITPFRYAEIVGAARGALLTAFITNNAFIVLPLLIEQSKALLEKRGLLSADSDSAAEAIVPILFNFPNAGKLLTLLFVPFAAWLSGVPLAFGDYSLLFGAGIPSYFAKAQVALPYLLDLFGLPHDVFQLYIPTTILTGKFDSLVTAMNLLVFALVAAAAMGGFLMVSAARILRAALLITGGGIVSVLLVRGLLSVAVDTDYRMDDVVRQMHQMAPSSAVTVYRGGDPLPPADLALSPLERIRSRGTLRVGYDPDNLPFSFINADDELVGFDVELAIQLADALEVAAEFVPIRWPDMPQKLANGEIDVMPGVWYRPYWFSSVTLSDPYLIGSMGLAVRDERRHEFSSVEALRRSRGLRIGVPLDTSQIELSMRRYFGDADVEWVVVEFWKPFFEGELADVDGFLVPAENASGWTLLHPEYAVVVPQPDPVRIPYAFGMALDADELAAIVNEWVRYAENAGEIRRAYTYWILGRGAANSKPRWSILRDVLGWEPG